MALQHLRSSTAQKRPVPSSLAQGQIALNTNDVSPGLYFRDSNGALIKAGPVHVGTVSPNATSAQGGHPGNSVGELWLDITGGDFNLKTWDGSAWRSLVVTSGMLKSSLALTGEPTAPTPLSNSNNNRIATTEFVVNGLQQVFTDAVAAATLNLSTVLALS